MSQGLSGNQSSNWPVTGGYRTERAPARRTLSIERLLVWTYRDQKVHLSGGMVGSYASGRSSDGVAVMMHTGGMIIDGGGSAGAGFEVHPDALAVDSAVGAIGGRGLVMRHAMAGNRPTTEVATRYVPRQVKENGKPVYLYNNKIIRNKPWLCELRLIGGPAEAAMVVDTYKKWRKSLAALLMIFKADDLLLSAHLLNEDLPPAL